jgi:phthalate 4,5-cis-dihydrodiol dehydrogenase
MTPIRLGVAGLGRAFTIMLPTLSADPRVRMVAAADPRPEACRQFERDFGARTHPSFEQLCADPGVDALYIATPHQMHAEHACLAARHGKHALVEKPMALSLAECTAMIAAAKSAGTVLIVGPSHSFDLPILRARAILAGGELGAVRMIHAMNYTDFLYRPRRPEELRTDEGGGVIFSQAAHQIDIVRLLGGGLVKSVRAATGNWDPTRPTEGAYSALLFFANGACASATIAGMRITTRTN